MSRFLVRQSTYSADLCLESAQYNSTAFFGVAGGYEASKLDIASAEHVGLLQSLVNTLANTSGLIAVPTAAWIVERGAEMDETHEARSGVAGNLIAGWGGVFTMVASLYLVASVVFLRWATHEKLFA